MKRSVWKISCVFIAAMLGAGFATGQEIWRFFGRFGAKGLMGLFLTVAVVIFVGCGILLKLSRAQCQSYRDFCDQMFGHFFGLPAFVVGCFFLYSTLCLMFSGSGVLFRQELEMGHLEGVCFMGAVCLCALLLGSKGMLVLNCVLTPLLLAGILGLSGYALLFQHSDVMASIEDLIVVKNHWFVAALVYISYNMITLPAVLTCVKKDLTCRKVAIASGVVSGSLLGVCGICVFFTTSFSGAYWNAMPMFECAQWLGDHFRLCYGILVYGIMLISAVSCAEGLLQSLFPNRG